MRGCATGGSSLLQGRVYYGLDIRRYCEDTRRAVKNGKTGGPTGPEIRQDPLNDKPGMHAKMVRLIKMIKSVKLQNR